MAEDYLTSLQEEIERKDKDLEALRSELQGNNEMPANVIKTSLIPEVPNYIKNIDALACASESDSVRLQANKLLIEWAVTDKLITGSDGADDEFKKLLKQLTSKTEVK
jgi:hypothetical protein